MNESSTECLELPQNDLAPIKAARVAAPTLEQRASEQPFDRNAAATYERSDTRVAVVFERPDDLERYRWKRINESMYYRLDWRWLSAWLIREGLHSPAICVRDSLVYTLAKHLQAETDSHSPLAPRSELVQAYELRRSNSMQTAEIQARLLAREDTATISARMDIKASVVELFHDLFFAIRPWLDCATLVRRTVFDERFDRRVHIPDFADLMKWSAYCHGPKALEELLWYRRVSRPEIPKKLKALSAAELAHADRWATINRLVVTLQTAPRNQRECIQYAEITMRQRH